MTRRDGDWEEHQGGHEGGGTKKELVVEKDGEREDFLNVWFIYFFTLIDFDDFFNRQKI